MTTLYTAARVGETQLDGVSVQGVSQKFIGNGAPLTSITVQMRDTGLVSGMNISCLIYAATAGGLPTGAALALSPDDYSDTALTPSHADYVYTFSGFTPVNGTVYCFTLEALSGTTSQTFVGDTGAGPDGGLNVDLGGGAIWTEGNNLSGTVTAQTVAAAPSATPTFNLRMFAVPGAVSRTTILMRDPTGAVAPTGATGQAVALEGLAGSASGTKGATASHVGAVGLSAQDSTTRGAVGQAISALGLSAVARGAEGAIRDGLGRVGLAGVETGRRNAFGLGVGRLGLSGVTQAVRSALGRASSSEGVAAIARGSQAILLNAFGFSAGAIGVASNESGAKGATSKALGAIGVASNEAGAKGATSSALGAIGLTAYATSTKSIPAGPNDRFGYFSGALGLTAYATGTKVETPVPVVVPIHGGGFGFRKQALVEIEAKHEPKKKLSHASGHAAGFVGVSGAASGRAALRRRETTNLWLPPAPFTREDVREVLIEIELRPTIPDDAPETQVASGVSRGTARIVGAATGTAKQNPALIVAPLALGGVSARGQQSVVGFATGRAEIPDAEPSDEDMAFIIDSLLEEIL